MMFMTEEEKVHVLDALYHYKQVKEKNILDASKELVLDTDPDGSNYWKAKIEDLAQDVTKCDSLISRIQDEKVVEGITHVEEADL